MQLWLRLLIVWWIAVALPVQGIAGVTMAHCGSSHQRMGAVLEVSQHPHAAHHHAAGMADHAHHATATGAKAQPGTSSDLGQFKCSSCASCCAGFAPPSALPRMPEPSCAAAVFSEEMVSVDAFASDGPDRPPRTPLV